MSQSEENMSQSEENIPNTPQPSPPIIAIPPRRRRLPASLQFQRGRNFMLRILYAAQKKLKYNRQTLYYSIYLLDRYLASGFDCADCSQQVNQRAACSIALIAAKFNSRSSLTLRQLFKARLMRHRHTYEEIINMELDILNELSYDLTQPERFSEKIAILEKELRRSCDDLEAITQTAIQFPALGRYGGRVLLKAVRHLANKTIPRAYHQRDRLCMHYVRKIITQLVEYKPDCLINISNPLT